jgi:hypothetical protein
MNLLSNSNMSGALVSLVSKGIQDTILTSEESDSSFFRNKFTRYTNFSQAPKQFDLIGGIQNSGSSTIFLTNYGDLINQVWLTSYSQNINNSLILNLGGTIFDLYIGGQLIDSQTFDFMADAWQVYIAETYSKSSLSGNFVMEGDYNFFPLHFFFCDNKMFLPLISLQYHQVELRIRWGPNVENIFYLKAFGNFIFLDKLERERFTKKPVDLLITQVQKITTPFSNASTTTFDLSLLNHPVKSIFFGYPQNNNVGEPISQIQKTEWWNFSDASLTLNGVFLFEKMPLNYFNSVNSYYNTEFSRCTVNNDLCSGSPYVTQYFIYNFCMNATSYKPTGTCNFSRLENAKLQLYNSTYYNNDIAKFPNPPLRNLTLYAVNYNVLRIKSGIAGILFSN